VVQCIDLCERLAAIRKSEHPGVKTELAMLLAMAGRFDEARAMNERARQIFVERMRVRRLLRFVAMSNAAVEMLAGEHVAAEREFRISLAFTRDMGEREPLALAAAGLASALRAQGRVEEAASIAAVSAQAAPSEAVAAQARSRAALARGFRRRKPS